MAKFTDIIAVAESLQDRYIYPFQDSCVAVRNRNASCRRCVEVCSVQAIEQRINELCIANDICIGCGECVSVCPTEALIALSPTDDELIAQGKSLIESCSGDVIFACARIASKGIAQKERYVEVPCLARLHEALLLGLAAAGAKDIICVDGVCATCKYHASEEVTDLVIATSNALLDTQTHPVRVVRKSEFPESALISFDDTFRYRENRRAFFSQAHDAAKKTAGKALSTVIDTQLHTEKQKPKTLRERLSATNEGTLPLIHIDNHNSVLDSLYSLGVAGNYELDTRLFGSVSIDTSMCNGCGMCVMFCPTGALSKGKGSASDANTWLMEFSTCKCVQCGLCLDVCLKKAVTLESIVTTDDLFSLEPQKTYLPALKQVSFFDRG